LCNGGSAAGGDERNREGHMSCAGCRLAWFHLCHPGMTPSLKPLQTAQPTVTVIAFLSSGAGVPRDRSVLTLPTVSLSISARKLPSLGPC
jgi:hypothetical protein